MQFNSSHLQILKSITHTHTHTLRFRRCMHIRGQGRSLCRLLLFFSFLSFCQWFSCGVFFMWSMWAAAQRDTTPGVLQRKTQGPRRGERVRHTSFIYWAGKWWTDSVGGKNTCEEVASLPGSSLQLKGRAAAAPGTVKPSGPGPLPVVPPPPPALLRSVALCYQLTLFDVWLKQNKQKKGRRAAPPPFFFLSCVSWVWSSLRLFAEFRDGSSSLNTHTQTHK